MNATTKRRLRAGAIVTAAAAAAVGIADQAHADVPTSQPWTVTNLIPADPSPVPAVHVDLSPAQTSAPAEAPKGSWTTTTPSPTPRQAARRSAAPGGHVVVHRRHGVRHVTTEGRTWKVRRGQTLTLISRATGVTVVDIVRANGIVDRNLVYAGQALHIPAGAR